MFGFSEEHKAWMLRQRCPRCANWVFTVKYVGPDGQQVPMWRPMPMMELGTVARCKKCNQTWPVFASAQFAPAAQPAPPAPAAAPAATPAAAPAAASATEVVETARTWTDHHVEVRELDNLGSDTSFTRTITINEEWSQEYVIDKESTRKIGGDLNLGLGAIASLGATAEQALRDRYSVTTNVRKSYTDELAFTVPPRKIKYVRMRYRQGWQEGFVRVTHPNTGTVEIPFKVAVGLRVDPETDDLDAPLPAGG